MNPFTPEEISLLRALIRPAIVLLILQRCDQPITAAEIATILGKDRHTIARYLRHLVELHLAVRVSYHGGYLFVDDERAPQAGLAKVKNKPDLSVININPTDLYPESLTTITAPHLDRVQKRTDRSKHTGRRERVGRTISRQPDVQDTPERAVLRQALREAGILEPKRSTLLELPHLTPQVVKDWEKYLKLVKGDRFSTGLLIHVLETGEPPPAESALPPRNPNGHPKSCQCPQCQRLRFLICPYCSRYPCECP